MSRIFQISKRPQPASSTSPDSPATQTWQLPSTHISPYVEKILGLKSPA